MSQQWYYVLGGKEHGPVAAAELKRLVVAGKLGPADVVRREDMAKCLPASQVKGLFAVTVATTSAGEDTAATKQARPVAARPAPRPPPKNDDGDEEPRAAGPREERQGGRRKMG